MGRGEGDSECMLNLRCLKVWYNIVQILNRYILSTVFGSVHIIMGGAQRVCRDN